MKKLFTLFTLLVLTITLMAQAPQKFTYQAIVRDASGKLMNSTQVGVRVSILKDNADGLSIYSEKHQQTTNANGLLSLEIGGGTVTGGDFEAIEWGNGAYFLKTEIDVTGGNNYTITTTQQLLSVPYALYAGSAANQFSGDYNDLSNKPEMPTIPTKVSVFENDAKYITKDSIPTQVSAFNNDAQYITTSAVPTKVSAFENDAKYITLDSLPTKVSAFENDAQYMQSYTETDPHVSAWAKEPNKPEYEYGEIKNKPNLANVATSGDYNDLSNKPTIPEVPTQVSAFNNDARYITRDSLPTKVSAFENDAQYMQSYTETDPHVSAWAKEPNKPEYEYGEIKNKPNLANVATSGDYNDLNNRPNLANVATSGNYNDLTNKPTIPTVPNNVGAFINDKGYVTANDIPAIPTKVSAFMNDKGYITNQDVPEIPTKVSAFTNDKGYITASNIPTKVSVFENDAHYLQSYTETDPHVSAWAKEPNKPAYDYSEINNKPNLANVATSGDYNDLSNRPNLANVATSGDYNDLSNKPTIPDVPTNVSAFTNDANYITLSEVPAETDPNVSAWAKEPNKPAYDYSEINNKPNLANVATSGDYNDLSNKPTIPDVPTQVSAFENDARYITRDSLPTKVSAFENDALYLQSYTETDPHVSAWAKEPNKPVYDYSEINNKPNLANVATSGDYNDLSNKPTIPEVPTQVSAFENDARYITRDSLPTKVSAFENDALYLQSYTETDPNVSAWAKEPNKPEYDYSEINNKPNLANVATSGDYNDLSNKPTIPDVPTQVSAFENDAKYITRDSLPTKVSAFENDAHYLQSYTEQQILSISNDTIYLTGGSFVKLPAGFSGSYNDLTDKPQDVSTFNNDARYITEAQLMDLIADMQRQIDSMKQGNQLPTVATMPVFNISDGDATCGGIIIDMGNSAVTVCGVCWSHSHNPTLEDAYGYTTDGSISVNFNSRINGFWGCDTFYVRAYATNKAGTSYGEEVSFVSPEELIYENIFDTICEIYLPWTFDGIDYYKSTDTVYREVNYKGCDTIMHYHLTVQRLITKASVSNITDSSAVCSAEVVCGAEEVIARGICWSFSQNPTLEDEYTIEGNGMGEFTSTLTGLLDDTTYYACAFAITNTDTIYGEEIDFVTPIHIYSDEDFFRLRIQWQTERYTGDDDPYVNGRSTPLVGDVDGDGEIEVVVPGTTRSAVSNNQALRPNTFITRNLVVLDGKTGSFKYLIKTCDYQLQGQPICIADADKDGKAEIYILSIGARKTSSKQEYGDKYLYCYDGSRKNSGPNDYLWKSDKDMGYTYVPMVADVNNDGFAEVVCGGCVFNAITGKTLIDGTLENEGMGFGDAENVHGDWQQSKSQELGEQYYLNALADIDGDGNLELCAGNTVYKYTLINPIGTNGNKIEVLRQCERTLPYDDMYDGQTMVIDFDNDGDLDVCVLGRNKNITNFVGDVNHLGIYVWEGQTNEMVGYFVCDPKTNSPSIPSAADIDGDGYPEVIFNGWHFGVNYGYSENRDQLHILKYQKGYAHNDRSMAQNIKEAFTRGQCREFSESTGATTFDFNRDGRAEILIRGDRSFYILDGTTLTKLAIQDEMSGTTAEYPIIADIDQDGHAEIIYTEEYDPGKGPAGGVTVLESDIPNIWSPARKVWNQWPYNAVNINENLTVPQRQLDISKSESLNGFLMQVSSAYENDNPDIPCIPTSSIRNIEITTAQLPYTFGDTVFNVGTQTGTYTLVRTNAGGCVNVITLNLTVLCNPTSSTQDIEITTAQLPYTFADTVFNVGTETGTYTLVRTNAEGCDSTITLNLTVLCNPTSSTQDIEITTAQLPYTFADTVFNAGTQTGTYTLVRTNAEGCDSVITLNLTVTAVDTQIIVGWSFPTVEKTTNATSFKATDGTAANIGVSEITVVNAEGATYPANTFAQYGNSQTIGEAKYYGIVSDGWHGMQSANQYYWLLGPISTKDAPAALSMEFYTKGSRTGPAYWNIDYRIGKDGEWVNTYSYTIIGGTAVNTIKVAELPSAIANQDSIYFRYAVKNNRDITGVTTTALGDTIKYGGTSYLYEIYVKGTIGTNPETPCTPTSTTQNIEITTAQLPYTFADTVFNAGTETGTYTLVRTNAEGCDSVITLNLTVLPHNGQPCPGHETLTDIDGNTYNTVQIGEQCWMKENLKTTKYADGTSIEQGSTYSYDVAYWYYPNNNSSNKATYGLLYNWKAVMRNSSSSSTNPSNVQGICPTGWHVPSDAEWTQLTDYVGSQSQYTCSGDNTYIAKALVSTTGWNSSSGTCCVGNTPSSNNATGFSAFPAGYYVFGYGGFGYGAYFWSATKYASYYAYYRDLYYSDAGVYRDDGNEGGGFSVRCLRDF